MRRRDIRSFSIPYYISDGEIYGPPGATLAMAKEVLKSADYSFDMQLCYDLIPTLVHSHIEPAELDSELKDTKTRWVASFEWKLALTLQDHVPPENVEFRFDEADSFVSVDITLADGWELVSWTTG